MDSNIETYNILDSLAAETYSCQQRTRDEVQNIENPIREAICEANAEKEKVKKCLNKAKEECHREIAKLQELERAQQNATNDEDKEAYRSRISAQQDCVAKAQAKVNAIEGIVSQVTSAIARLESSCQMVMTAKHNFCSAIQETTDHVGASLNMFQCEMSEASNVFQSVLNRYN